MATVSAASASNNRTSQNSPLEENGLRLRDASFSSYLARDDDNFIATPTSPVTNATESLHQLSFGRKHQQDGEISIFAAAKYFEGGKKNESTVSCNRGRRAEKQKVGRSDQLRAKPLFQSPAPSLCSEVMGGNGQTALLQKDPAPINWQKQSASRRIFSSFSCSSCSRKKSVNINEEATESRNASRVKTIKAVDFRQPLCQETATNDVVVCRNPPFNFSAVSQTPRNMTLRRQFEADEKVGTLPPKTASGEFGFRFLAKDSSYSPLPSLTMLTSDAGRKINEEIAECTVEQSRRVQEDDLGSDSSSDLFEIESLTGKAYRISSRRPSDDLSSCAASTERSSMTTSDDHDCWKQTKRAESPTRFAATTTTCKSSTIKISMVKEAQQRRRQNSLLGCKGSNSVEVAAAAAVADAYRNSRFQSDFESMHAQRVLATSTSSALFIHG